MLGITNPQEQSGYRPDCQRDAGTSNAFSRVPVVAFPESTIRRALTCAGNSVGAAPSRAKRLRSTVDEISFSAAAPSGGRSSAAATPTGPGEPSGQGRR